MGAVQRRRLAECDVGVGRSSPSPNTSSTLAATRVDHRSRDPTARRLETRGASERARSSHAKASPSWLVAATWLVRLHMRAEPGRPTVEEAGQKTKTEAHKPTLPDSGLLAASKTRGMTSERQAPTRQAMDHAATMPSDIRARHASSLTGASTPHFVGTDYRRAHVGTHSRVRKAGPPDPVSQSQPGVAEEAWKGSWSAGSHRREFPSDGE